SVIQHSAASDRPINPILVRNALEREVCSLDELGEARSRDSEFQKLLELWRPEMEQYFRQAEQAYEEPVFSAFEPIEIEAYPAFVRLDDFTLLRISQDPYTVSFE